MTLQSVIHAALQNGSLTSAQAVSLLTLLESTDSSLLETIIDKILAAGGSVQTGLLETIAKDQLLRFGVEGRDTPRGNAIASKLASLSIPNGPWNETLRHTTEFLSEAPKKQNEGSLKTKFLHERR